MICISQQRELIQALNIIEHRMDCWWQSGGDRDTRGVSGR